MIEANELRIGNWVYQEGYIQLDEKFLIVFFGSFSYKELFPIQLNIEILESCGFRKVKHPEDNIEFLERQFGDRIKFKLTKASPDTDGSPGFLVAVELNPGTGYDMLVNQPRHLHQLQNLIFALTGEELEVRSFDL